MVLHTGWLLQVSYTLKSIHLGSPQRYAPELSEVLGPQKISIRKKRSKTKNNNNNKKSGGGGDKSGVQDLGAGLPVLGILEL